MFRIFRFISSPASSNVHKHDVNLSFAGLFRSVMNSLNPTKRKEKKFNYYWLRTDYLSSAISTFLNPMSFEYSLKHWRQRLSPYLRMIPWLLEQARLETKNRTIQPSTWNLKVRNNFRWFFNHSGRGLIALHARLTNGEILDRIVLDEHTRFGWNPWFKLFSIICLKRNWTRREKRETERLLNRVIVEIRSSVMLFIFNKD